MDFDISFFEELTFITGINGTGKTSALNAIASLLMPRLDYLAVHEFDEIHLFFEDEGENVRLSAEKLADETVLNCSKFPNVEVSFEAFDDPMDYYSYKSEELEERYYKELMESFSANQIIRYILDLPTPMFLGLDRRSRTLDQDNHVPRRLPSRRAQKRRRNIFGSSLSNSLVEAQYFAENTFLDCQRKKNNLDRKFRDNLIFELLNFPLNDFSGFMRDESILSKRKLATTKENVYRIPQLLDLNTEAITSRLDDLFQFIEKNMVIASQSIDEADEEEPWNTPSFNARLALAENKSSIEKMNALSGLVTEYTKNIKSIFSRVEDFVDRVNSFIQDSDKSVHFDDRGHLSFRLGGELAERDLRTLSSGEIQLIVIFAHLYFNPETEKANIFIIDEPELSLHVQWQAKFVDAVLGASTNTQFIMASHSPTVIMNRLKYCKEIIAKNG